MYEATVRSPWKAFYGCVPESLDYSSETISGAVRTAAHDYPEFIAYSYFNRKVTYTELQGQIEKCARALCALGVRKGDSVTICLPNCPQALMMFYAVNRIGALANMVHPLSGEKEIEFYLKDSNSTLAITLDLFIGNFTEAVKNAPALKHLIVTGAQDEMSAVMKLGYKLTKARGVPRVKESGITINWKNFMARAEDFHAETEVQARPQDPAAILYSGGTTGTSKGVLLSNLNFNALGLQIIKTNPAFGPGDTMLAILPMFHGFGLGVGMHSMLINGGQCILVPQFTPKTYAELLDKHKPNFIAGVPTLFEALLRLEGLEKLDMSALKGMYSGGDSLSPELKRRVDKFLREHGAKIEVREGYGATECVSASCLTPYHMSREGSIGIPFPDTYFKIVNVGSQEEAAYGEEGEICVSGPTVMIGYNNKPEETASALRVHADGRIWLHTGDLGTMDADGFVYFRQRIKRMIITSGYNVYPSRVEAVLEECKYVQLSCVIGVPDEYRVQRVKAYVVLRNGYEPSDELRAEIIEHCKKNLAKFAVPRELEFRDDLPKTMIGKVAYRKLEEETAVKTA